MRKLLLKISPLLLLLFLSGCSTDRDDQLHPKLANYMTLGASARDLLSDEIYKSLRIEVVSVEGYELSDAALKGLQGFLEKYTRKPGGISFSRRSIPSPEKAPYEVSEIKALEDELRTTFNSDTELAVFIFVADGKSSNDSAKKTILGTAYRNTSIVIYGEAMRELPKSGLVGRSQIEGATLKHEFGHLFGLVDNGSPAQSPHSDPDSDSHCNVGGCLMLASVEFGDGAMAFLKSRKQMTLDPKCRADLKANGGK